MWKIAFVSQRRWAIRLMGTPRLSAVLCRESLPCWKSNAILLSSKSWSTRLVVKRPVSINASFAFALARWILTLPVVCYPCRPVGAIVIVARDALVPVATTDATGWLRNLVATHDDHCG